MSLSEEIARLAERVGLELARTTRPGDPGLARAWGRVWLAPVLTLAPAHNFSDVRLMGRNTLQLRFSAPLASADYTVLVSPGGGPGLVSVHRQDPEAVEIQLWPQHGRTPEILHIAVFG